MPPYSPSHLPTFLYSDFLCLISVFSWFIFLKKVSHSQNCTSPEMDFIKTRDTFVLLVPKPIPEIANVSCWWQAVFYRTSPPFSGHLLNFKKSSTTPGKVRTNPRRRSLWILSWSLLGFLFFIKNKKQKSNDPARPMTKSLFQSIWRQLLGVHIWLLIGETNVPCLVLKHLGNFAWATIWHHTPSFPYFRSLGSLLFFHLYFRPGIVIKRREEISLGT